MRIVDDIEQQIQKSEFLAILIQAMKSIGESRTTDQYRTVINGLLQKNLPIDTFEQDLKVAPTTISRQREHQSATPSRWREYAEWRMKNSVLQRKNPRDNHLFARASYSEFLLYCSIILTISAGVTTNGLTGKCLTFPVTR